MQRGPGSDGDPEEEPSRGPNLVVIYGLILLAMLVATAVAAFIVYPFYHRH